MTKKIKEVLPSLLKTDNWKLTLLSEWHTIFGPLSTKVHLEKIHEDILVLGVQDSCWLQELYLLSPLLLKTINETLDQPRIKQLRFKTIGIKKQKQSVNQKKMNIKRDVTLSATELKALQKVQDPQLEQALKNFLIRCYQERG